MTKYEYLRDRLFKFSKWNGTCLESTYKSRSQSGYAVMKYKKSTKGAHRVSWLVHNGDIPVGKWVLHKCDNPLCINPDHLFIGTPQENTNDMIDKGRNHFNGAMKFSEQQAYLCAKLRIEGKTYKKISDQVGCSIQCVYQIIKNRKYVSLEAKSLIGKPKFPPEIRKKAWDLRKSGTKCKDIQKILSIPKRTLGRILKDYAQKGIDL